MKRFQKKAGRMPCRAGIVLLACACLSVGTPAMAEQDANAVSERIQQTDPCSLLSLPLIEAELGAWMAPLTPTKRQFMPTCAVPSENGTAINLLSLTLLNDRATGLSMDRIQLDNLAKKPDLVTWETPDAVVHYDAEGSTMAVIHESGMVGFVGFIWTGPNASASPDFEAALRRLSDDLATRMTP